MGLNFYCACHRCRESMCVSRGDEHQGLHSFFDAHAECVRRGDVPVGLARPPVIEIQGDYLEQSWMVDDSYSQWYFSTMPQDTELFSGEAERWQMGWRVPNR